MSANATTQPTSQTSMFSSFGASAASLYGKMTENPSTNTIVLVLIVVTILIFVLVIIWICFSIKGANLKGKALTSEPIKLDTITTPLLIDSGMIPTPVVGREYSYSFWVYVDDYTPTISNNHKLIFYRGSTNGDLTSANIVVFMDGMSNKLYMALKTQGNNLDTGSTSNLQNIISNNYFMNSTLSMYNTAQQHTINLYTILTIDYLPIQRWVNIGIIIDNTMLTLYVDGEIYSVKTTAEFLALRPPDVGPDGSVYNPVLVMDKSVGSIHIGKSKAIAGGNVPNAYLSTLSFYNYALSINDVKTNYRKGPLSSAGILSRTLGIPYGVRSPVYKIGDKL